MRRLLLLTTAAVCLLPVSVATANTSHEGWPRITGMLLMNKTDASRPLDARPGHDPFAGTDPRYSCDSVHLRGKCQRRMVRTAAGVVVTSRAGHNELLGGHGSDTISAGPWGDVLWGDYKPSGQNSTQHDTIIGGVGNDFIYSSHGVNAIAAGGGERLRQGPLRQRLDRLRRRPRQAVHQPPRAAPLHDPRLRDDLAQDARRASRRPTAQPCSASRSSSGRLRGEDPLARLVEAEPRGAVDLGELAHRPRARRPLHREGVRARSRRRRCRPRAPTPSTTLPPR